MGVWTAFWASVIAMDMVHDLFHAQLNPSRGLPWLLREWTAFWGTWLLVSAPWIAMARWLDVEARHWLRVIVAVGTAALVGAVVHLGAAALAFELIATDSLSVLRRWLSFVVYLLPRDVLIGAALGALLAAVGMARRARHARLLALQRDLNPHFVLNVLNGLSGSLRGGEPDVAVEVVARLGRMLRSQMEQPDQVELRQELDTVEDYLGLQALRLGARLQVDWSVEPEVERALVPSFLVQPVAENAVVHGVQRVARPVRIALSARRYRAGLRVEVDDTGPGPASGRAQGVGLGVLRRRLRLLYGARAWCHLGPRPGGGTRVRIQLPLRLAR
ncbi:MAG: histidine kinase [Myxococcales bacterium]|nr:histidine kinase [Myxococcales bacterium]